MNILQLCKAAERYEMLCMMNLTEDEIRKAADRYEIPFYVLYNFIVRVGCDCDERGIKLAFFISKKPSFVESVLLNSDFYEIWEHAVNS